MYGKTELILAIVESYLIQNPTKNVVILVPDDTIKKEMITRSDKWDLFIKPEYHKFNGRLQLINPIGIGKSTKFKSKDNKIMDYLNNTGLVLIDEVHHLSASSYLILMDSYLNNYELIYGFSGTIDAAAGKVPVLKDIPQTLSGRLNRIISYIGFPRIDVKNEAPVRISYLRVKGTSVPEKLKTMYHVSLKIFFNSPKLLDAVVDFLEKNPGRRIFLPINEIKQGKIIVDKVTKRLGADSCVFVQSGSTYPNVKDLGYTGVKDYMRSNPKFRMIVGTTAIYEGFDSDMINTVLLGVGKSQRMTIQPTGRGTRSEDIPWVLLPWDTSGTNAIVNKQTKSRYETLKREFKNYKFISLE